MTTNITPAAASLAVLTEHLRTITARLQSLHILLTTSGPDPITFPESTILHFCSALKDSHLTPDTLSSLYQLALAILPPNFDPSPILANIRSFFRGALAPEVDTTKYGPKERNAVKVFDAYLRSVETLRASRVQFASAVVQRFGLVVGEWDGTDGVEGDGDVLRLFLGRAVWVGDEEGMVKTLQELFDSVARCCEGADVVVYFVESGAVDFFVKGKDGGLVKCEYEWDEYGSEDEDDVVME